MRMIQEEYEFLIDFLQNSAHKLVTKDGDEWFYCPFWFKRDSDKLIMLDFNNLPQEVIDKLNEDRNGDK